VDGCEWAPQRQGFNDGARLGGHQSAIDDEPKH